MSKYLQRLSGPHKAWNNYYLIVNRSSFYILGHFCVVLKEPRLSISNFKPILAKQCCGTSTWIPGFVLGFDVQMFMANKKPATNIFLQHVV